MPELPEVETVRRTLLEGGLAGQAVSGLRILHPDAVRHPDPERFRAEVVGRTVRDVRRRGKFLLVDLGGPVLACHLRMTGRLWLSAPEEAPLPHTHVVFELSDGRELRFRDVRRFGGFSLIDPDGRGAPDLLARLGPEPEDLRLRQLEAACQRHARLPVKALLLDQEVVAGLGNIYADEALHRARVHPARTCGSLSRQEIQAILKALGAVLRDALRHRGTTLLDYRDGSGEPGGFREFLRVYGREGQPCRRCGAPIAKRRIAGRGTHFCPVCQEGE